MLEGCLTKQEKLQFPLEFKQPLHFWSLQLQ